MPNNDVSPISPEEDKKIREELYKQNLELARLYKQVDSLNKQRESLMHLINHKVKGAFTRSKYIFAGMLDGTFGDVNDEIKKRAQQGLDSDDTGIKTVDLVLNASNLQKDAVKYEMKTIDFKDLVAKVIAEKKLEVQARGLVMQVEVGDDVCNISGDAFWVKEAVSNLIENSIKYTKAGTITVGLE